ncbi:MAG: hypothetical protein Q9207_005714 [Kuettlingeria erythrocarpa]
MDPITGIGLAAAVVQLVSVGIETVKTCQQVYDKWSISELNNLDETSGHLARLTRSLQQSLQGSSKGPQTLSTDEKDLVDLGRKCQDCADKLQRKLRKLQTQRRTSVLVAVKQGVRVIWEKNSIEKKSRRVAGLSVDLREIFAFSTEVGSLRKLHVDDRRYDPDLDIHYGPNSGFEPDLCTLYFSHSQRGLEDAPFVYKEVARSELVAACRTLRTRLLSHTAGILELTPQKDSGRFYGKAQDLDPRLVTQVNFFHKTVRDFLLDNAEIKSSLAYESLTEAKVRLSIARGILTQVAHFAQGDALVVDDVWPNPVYEPFLASLQQISLVERFLGAAQVELMHSLDYATFARGYLLSDHVCEWSR